MNNFSNLERNEHNAWNGEIASTGRFCSFDTPINGIRAYFLNLHAAIVKHNRNTIKGYVTAFAPPNENKTDKYIADMCHGTGIGEDEDIPTDRPFLIRFAHTQFVIEVGHAIANAIEGSDFTAALDEVESLYPGWIK